MEHKKEIYNCATGELTIEPLTAKEIAEREKVQEIADKELLEFEEKLVKRNALLAKLGITEDEAKLLFS
jgi:hypothetical protein